MAGNKVHLSIEAPGGRLCADIFRRPDGSWGFEEYLADPEDGRGWIVTGFHAALRFETADEAEEAARRSCRWLDST